MAVRALVVSWMQLREWMGVRFLSWSACVADDFRAWLFVALKEELAPATMKLCFAALRALDAYMMAREGLSGNPLDDGDLPRKRQRLQQHLSLMLLTDLLNLPLICYGIRSRLHDCLFAMWRFWCVCVRRCSSISLSAMMDSEPFRSLFCWAMVLLEMLFLGGLLDCPCRFYLFRYDVAICLGMLIAHRWGERVFLVDL